MDESEWSAAKRVELEAELVLGKLVAGSDALDNYIVVVVDYGDAVEQVVLLPDDEAVRDYYSFHKQLVARYASVA